MNVSNLGTIGFAAIPGRAAVLVLRVSLCQLLITLLLADMTLVSKPLVLVGIALSALVSTDFWLMLRGFGSNSGVRVFFYTTRTRLGSHFFFWRVFLMLIAVASQYTPLAFTAVEIAYLSLIVAIQNVGAYLFSSDKSLRGFK